jgi:transposase
MRQQTRPSKEPAEKVVQDIRRATRKHYSAEEKIRIVLEGLRGEDSIAELYRREGIAPAFQAATHAPPCSPATLGLPGASPKADVRHTAPVAPERRVVWPCATPDGAR